MGYLDDACHLLNETMGRQFARSTPAYYDFGQRMRVYVRSTPYLLDLVTPLRARGSPVSKEYRQFHELAVMLMPSMADGALNSAYLKRRFQPEWVKPGHRKHVEGYVNSAAETASRLRRKLLPNAKEPEADMRVQREFHKYFDALMRQELPFALEANPDEDIDAKFWSSKGIDREYPLLHSVAQHMLTAPFDCRPPKDAMHALYMHAKHYDPTDPDALVEGVKMCQPQSLVRLSPERAPNAVVTAVMETVLATADL